MDNPSRSAFEAELQRLGYGPVEAFDYDPCTHAATVGCAVFVMPSREDKYEAETYGELGWQVYEGCKACCMGFAQVLFCGGMFTCLRIFVGDVLTESAGDPELRPAGDPLVDEDQGPKE